MMKSFLFLLISVGVALATYAQSPNEDVKIYDSPINAQADIDLAVAKAKKENKYVFV